jgi:putative ABC transport system permease protein
VVVGLGAAWSLTRLIAGFLYGVRGHDALVFIAVPVLLSVVALLAVLPAANRASGVNPSDSLRYE